MPIGESFEERAVAAIKAIPFGKVATYGQIAGLAGSPRAARAVGMILRHRGEFLPWHRVVNAQGRISIENAAYPPLLQKELLEQEAIEVEEIERNYSVSLDKFRWIT